MGIAGRFTYAFRDKYFAEFNFGYNGSENFAPGKRYGFFPSYAVGYMISNEKFWEPLRDKINILKIRASYGKIGNDEIGGSRRFAYNTTMNTNAGGFTFRRSGTDQSARLFDRRVRQSRTLPGKRRRRPTSVSNWGCSTRSRSRRTTSMRNAKASSSSANPPRRWSARKRRSGSTSAA